MNSDDSALPGEVLTAVYEAVDSPVFVCDTDGRIVDANPAATRFGYSRERLRTLGIGDLSAGDPPHTADRAVGLLAEAAAGTPRRVGWRLADGDGTRIPVELTLRSAPGGRVVVVVHDRPEGDGDRPDLRTQRDRLAALNRIFRHELSNDLAAALGVVPALERTLDDADHLDLLRRKQEHMSTLTDRARVVAETVLDPDPEQFAIPVSELLADDLDRLEGRDGVVVDRPAPLPDAPVWGDHRLSDAFRAVLTNAVEHNDSAPARIAVSVEATEAWITVHVADDGPGIPDDQKDDLFGRGPGGLDRPGTGLGLYLVETVVTHHGGEVWAEDNEPRGTVVSVRLPAAGGPTREGDGAE